MRRAWERALTRWVEAGLVDPGLEARIRAFQEERHGEAAIVQPMVRIALALGGVLIAAAVLLFVSANWEALSPLSRFGIVLLLVGGFHAAAVAVERRFPALAPVLHALGTVSLGAGIFITGQIFNLDEHWPGGVMMWAAGAVLALVLLRDQAHAALVAILVPAWIVSEGIAAGDLWRAEGFGIFLLALAYFTVPAGRVGSLRRPLRMIGGIALLPAGCFLTAMVRGHLPAVPLGLLATAWVTALLIPLLVALWTRGAGCWKWIAAAAWTLLLLAPEVTHDTHLVVYLWAAGACSGLAWWGLSERRPERVNLAVAGFALAVLAFYFDSVIDKMGRSVSLLGLGLLFLAGGYALERARRRMLARMNEVGV